MHYKNDHVYTAKIHTELSVFLTEKLRISADHKTTVHSHCTTDVQPMNSSVSHPTVPSFHILCGPFAKEQGSFYSFY